VWLVSVVIGLSTSLILLTSHFHQVEGDRAAGKRSPLVRMGVEAGLKVLQAGVAACYGLVAAGVLAGLLPAPAAMAAMLLSLPAAREMLTFAADNYSVPARIAPLKRYACSWHIALGSSLAAGLAVSRLTAGMWI
jgi:1,4-dihydroxy-2-naphthoate octaprenyltransferase